MGGLFKERGRLELDGLVQRILAQMQECVFRTHPLGFFACILSSAPGTNLRLHFWPPDSRSQESGFEVHDHAYSLTSVVLRGALEHREYDVSFATPAPNSAVYEVEYSDAYSILKKTKLRSRTALNKSVKVVEGETYGIPSSVFHATHCVSPQGAISVVETRLAVGHVPRVLGPANGPDHMEFRRCVIPGTGVHTMIRDLLTT
jgi:hypothetical protein